MGNRLVTDPVTFLGPLRKLDGCYKFALVQPQSAPLELSYDTKTQAQQARDDMARSTQTMKVPNGKMFEAITKGLQQAREHAIED
jgi:hypothetical protein